MVEHDPQRVFFLDVSLHLCAPVAHDANRSKNECGVRSVWRATTEFSIRHDQRNSLNGLAEPHIISQDASASELRIGDREVRCQIRKGIPLSRMSLPQLDYILCPFRRKTRLFLCKHPVQTLKLEVV